MQYQVIYVRKPPKWKGEPGTLYRPVPRNADEVAAALKTILADAEVERITIIPLEPPKVP